MDDEVGTFLDVWHRATTAVEPEAAPSRTLGANDIGLVGVAHVPHGGAVLP